MKFLFTNSNIEYEISFGKDIHDWVWIKTTTKETWGVASISFGREIKNRKVLWKESDRKDKLIHLIPELENYIDKLLKLRAFL